MYYIACLMIGAVVGYFAACLCFVVASRFSPTLPRSTGADLTGARESDAKTMRQETTP